MRPYVPGHLDRSARVYIAGHRGLVGSALWRRFAAEGFTDVIGRSSAELDLRDRAATKAFLRHAAPDVIVVAAARVGGILANSTYPADFLSDNLLIQANLLDAAADLRVDRLVFLGSSCIYPRDAAQPIREDSLLTGPLEPTNAAYAIAKIAGIMHVQAVRQQHGLHWISAMPTNLYGPNDNFDPLTSHVLPALIRRVHDAVGTGAPDIVLWGTGTPRREFLHADDLARAVLHLLENYDAATTINVGTGEDLPVRDLASIIAEVAGYTGTFSTNPDVPDGTPRKLLDVSRIRALGWEPRIALREGITSVYTAYAERIANAATGH